ncbi:hypothetical protein ACNTMW_29940 [Planosporangium sp. 12N6]|uniref:YncE family protein n=1 Tax=Planosporangium spinosum TaxID=3402278 RepID=UPI003CED6908
MPVHTSTRSHDRAERRRPRALRTAAAAGVATALLVGTVPGTAHAAVADRPVRLPIGTVADVAATGNRVFVSGGRTSNDLVVTNAAGGAARTVSGLPGPTDLLLSTDRATLYVALPNTGEIAAIDTATLAQKARYRTGAPCPSSLAITGTSLWFGYGCGQWGGDIGRVDLAAIPATVTLGLAGGDFYDFPLLATASGNQNVLFAGQPSLSPGSVSVFSTTVTDGRLPLVGRTDHTAVGSNLRDVAATADGAMFYTASGAPYEVVGFATTDLTQARRRLPTVAYPNAVELSPDGQYLAAGSDASYDPDVFLFRQDGTPVATVELNGPLLDRALVWAPNGKRLYAVTGDRYASTPQSAVLHVIEPTWG